MFDLSPERIRTAVVYLIALVLSVAVHEFGHALIADKLGDPTPRSQGRVTLNPLVHADPIGTLLFPLVALLAGPGILFGWGRPVQISPVAFTRKLRMKTSHLLVAIAGPLMNVGLAVLVTIIYAVLLGTHILAVTNPIVSGLQKVIMLNWVLAFFNLIPCPPLDGGAVLAGLLPEKYDNINQFLEQYGFIILIGLLITGVISYLLIPADIITRLTLNFVHRLVF